MFDHSSVNDKTVFVCFAVFIALTFPTPGPGLANCDIANVAFGVVPKSATRTSIADAMNRVALADAVFGQSHGRDIFGNPIQLNQRQVFGWDLGQNLAFRGGPTAKLVQINVAFSNWLAGVVEGRK